MTSSSRMTTVAAAGLLALAAWAPQAAAGHLNTVLEAALEGRQNVAPASGGDTARGRAYVFGIDGDNSTLCYTLLHFQGVDELAMAPGQGRAAHIHEGARGSNGPVVVNLAWPQDGQAGDCLSERTAGKFPTAEAGIVQRILKNPSQFYINLHNAAHPAGVLRGQLADTADHRH